LIALELQPADEVIVPAATFVATLEAITRAGAVPVIADLSDLDYYLDAVQPPRRSCRGPEPSCPST
jgi:dTDP-4-amino-4,6-dideoxygalactose transaminase